MKLMTYNILDGGAERLNLIIQVVKNEVPDYLTLNEANGFEKDNSQILKKFANAISTPYFDIALSGEYDYHVAVFSKYPLKKVHKLKPLMRACLIAQVESPLGPISIASLHLTPYSEDLRDGEIDHILDFQKEYENRVLMGDMNSLSIHDEYNPEMVKDFTKGQLEKYTTNGVLRFNAIGKIESAGYFDSALKLGKNKENTVPTVSNKDTHHARMRLDYLFLSKSLAHHLRKYAVIKNDLTEQASDHYPVVVELI